MMLSSISMMLVRHQASAWALPLSSLVSMSSSRWCGLALATQCLAELSGGRGHQPGVSFDFLIPEAAVQPGEKQGAHQFAIGAEHWRPDADDIRIAFPARDAVAVTADLVVSLARRPGEGHQHVAA